ncbi:MAG: amino acid adenylation domain-containing protein [Burkholderia sp.]
MTLDQIIALYEAGQLSGDQVSEAFARLSAGTDIAVDIELSETQRGLWSLQKAYPQLSAYNVPLCLRLPADLDRKRFLRACRSLLERWPVLGASVEQREGPLRLHATSASGLSLEYGDGSAWSESERLDWLRERIEQPVDLAKGPLTRAHWLDGAGGGESLFLLVVHHLVIDGASVGLLLAGLHEAYRALGNGEAVPGTSGSDGYAGFVRAERTRLQGDEASKRLAYWREQLTDAPSSLGLPPDHARGATPSFKGRTLRRELPAALNASLQAYTERHGVYPSTLLLAVFQGLLSRHAGRDDVVVGMAMDERDAASAGLVGMFVNMLPMRARGLGRRGFGEDVQTLQRQLVDAMAHAYPFPALVRELGLSGSDASPLFQAAFLYQDTLDVDALAEVKDWTWEEALYQEGEYELVLEVRGGRQSYALYFKYDPTLWDERTIERWLGHYLHLLESVLADPRKRLGEHELRDEHERAQLASWQGEVRDWALTPVAALFERQVAVNAQAWAVSDEQQRWSYAELAAQSSAIAQRLRAQGIGAGSIVGVCQSRSPWLLASLLGIWQAGAAYVPLDPAYPAERLRYMLEDSGAGAVLSDATHLAQIQTLAGTLPVWTADVSEWSASAPLPMPMPQPQDLAYVLYTSGSTGRPKGVCISHGALSNFLQSMVETPGLKAGDRLLAVTTISFDIAGLELYLPLIGGGECVLCSAEVSRDGRCLKAEVERVHPTLMQATPATWSMLFHAGWRNAEGLKVLCGGEGLPTRLKQRFDEIGTTVWNLYGPTETTIWSTLAKLDANASIHIGRPIANTQAYVLDEDGREQPIGIEGELYLGGAGLAQGYHGQPERTSQAFIGHPLGRLYRTGDLARWRADGQLEHRGRSDQQVKVNGHRVEPGEIEAVLEQSGLVKQVAVVLREGAHGSQLAAWCVPIKTTCGDTRLDSVQIQALQAQLRDRVPAYMQPSIWLGTAALPQTPNGKVDRQALRARALPAQSDEKAPPRPIGTSRNAARLELESRLQALWAEVLERPTVGRDERFLEAGGNSVAAVLLAERIQAEFGRAFGVAQVFAHISVAAQAAYLDGSDPTPEAPVNEPIAPRAVVAEPKPDASGIAEDALAIIGIACHFPGAENHRAFWDNLRAGHDSARLFSPEALRAAGVPERLIADPQYVPVHYGIEGKAEFDAEFFNLPPRTVTRMDPPFRLLLQHAWAAIEDAGYRPEAIPDTAVYMATGGPLRLAEPSEQGSPGDSDDYVNWLLAQPGTVATMVSYQLGLRGPSYAVHANCSSSLVGMHAAAQSLRSGEVRTALVGAASLFGDDSLGYRYEPGLNFSSDGHCKTFDSRADGLVAGEGVAVVLLKRAREAVADGDHIYALLRGVAVNNDGADKAGFYAPSVRGQSAVIEQALRQARIDPAQIGYVEAHGTGTRLGDPIEVTALSETYRCHTQALQYCAIGSVKSNLGHLDTAAGLAGCIKLALSLKHGEIPPTLHYQQPNPAIDFAASPFYVAERLQAWPPGPRLAGLSAFGIGGTNTHAILEAWPLSVARQQPEPAPGMPQVLPLSAMQADRLPVYVRRLAAFLRGPHAVSLRLVDVAYTLQTGRRAMPARCAFVAETLDQLLAALDGYVAMDDASLMLPQPTPAAGWQLQRDAYALAAAWRQGESIDWQALQTAAPWSAHRVSLPTYPFVPKRWPRPAARGASGAQAAVLHPLLHGNTSDFAGHRYSSRFVGEEFFLADHVMGGHKVLPGVAHLEMARAAFAQAIAAPHIPLELRDVVWIRPVGVDAPLDVHTALRPRADGSADFEIYSQPDAASERIVHSQGRAMRVETAAAEPLELDALRRQIAQAHRDAASYYRDFQQGGASYGPAFRALEQLWLGDGQGLARLVLPAVLHEGAERYGLHPSLLDAAVQAAFIGIDAMRAAAGVAGAEQGGSLPFELKRVQLLVPCQPAMWAWVRYAQGIGAGDRVQRMDVDLCDEQGRICVRLHGLARLAMQASKPAAPSLQLPQWEDAPLDRGADAPPYAQRLQVLCAVPAHGLEPESGTDLVERLEAGTGLDSVQDYALRLLARVQSFMRNKPRGRCLLQVVIPAEGEMACLAALAGLVYCLRLEHPGVSAQLITVNPEIAAPALAALLREEGRGEAADAQVRHLHGRRQRKALAALALPAAASAPQPWRQGGVYLITGGTGGLGRLFAQEIAARCEGAGIVLLGRSTLSPEQAVWIERLGRNGTRVIYCQADVTDAAAVEAAVCAARELGPLRGVLHAAGVLRDGLLLNRTEEQARAVLVPKLAGSLALDRATRELDLDFFVLFSSISALGSVGQSDYAVANAFLDEFAHWRAVAVARGERRGRSLAIAWPLWAEGGMRPATAALAGVPGALRQVALPSAQGLACFYQALASAHAQVVVPAPAAPAVPAAALSLAASVATAAVTVVSPAPPAPSSIPSTHKASSMASAAVSTIDIEALGARLCGVVLGLVTQLLGVPAEQVDLDEEFNAFGFDSISLTNLANHLNQELRLNLTPAIFFEHASVNRFVEHLLAEHAERLDFLVPASALVSPAVAAAPAIAPPRAEPEPAAASAAAAEHDDIAIIGMSARLPMAADLAQFWDNLLAGRDCISEIPADRWDWREIYGDPLREPNRTDAKWGGFIDGVADFDPLFFGISPREAEAMDPHQRLLMSHVWQALEDAGYTRQALSGSDTGVFVGLGGSDYGQRVVAADGGVEGHTLMGLLPSMAPARMSHFMNWHGPSEFIDTACSSSLVAVHRAAQAIAAGDCSLAVVGGVMAILSPTAHIGFSKAGMLSKDGRCKTFSSEADGYVRGEGVGMLVLKRLSAASADGDCIHAVIRASAVNHGGRANTLTSPNPAAQAELIESACRKAGVAVEQIGYIEAHGTGTRLGDPIEINGLKSAFKSLGHGVGEAWCGLGSVKTNIGHLELSAGIAGLLKLVLQLRHRTLVASLHCEQVNPYIELEGSPFYLVRENRPWPAGRDASGRPVPRLAGVSSFGFGGVNAHVLVQEHLADPLPVDDEAPALIVLSARSEAALRERARDLLAYLGCRGLDRPAVTAASDDRRAELEQHIRVALAGLLDVDAREISVNESFEAYGLDALARNRLAAALDESSPALLAGALRAGSVAQLADEWLAAQGHAPALAAAPLAEPAIRLGDLAYTLQVGREPMEHRLGFMAASFVQLRERLQAFLDGQDGMPELHRGQSKSGKNGLSLLSDDDDMDGTLASWAAKKKYALMLKLWVNGLELNWRLLHAGRQPRRISLPAYPFDYRRCWVGETPAAATQELGKAVEPAALVDTSDETDKAESAQFLLPVWDAVHPDLLEDTSPQGRILLCGDDEGILGVWRGGAAEQAPLVVRPGTSIEALSAQLAVAGTIGEVLFVAPDMADLGIGDAQLMIEAQQQGVLGLFRLIKALLATGHGLRDLAWTVVTTQAVDLGDGLPPRPAHAGIHGLASAMAREYPHWCLRLVDVSAGEAGDWPICWRRLPHTEGGAAWCRRGGEWFRQHLLPYQPDTTGTTDTSLPYRQGGVYLVIGGAGGLGEAWSRHMIERYQARLIWLGRSAFDARIRERIDALAALGPAPRYVQADAGDEAALRRAAAEIGREFPRLHGIVHSALVLADQGLASMPEVEFAGALAAKVDTAVLTTHVFANQPLDFVLFFSSMMSFGRAAGQSNYAAGCVFADVYARRLAQLVSYPVKIVNWGYWGSVGIVSRADYQARMRRAGIGSIEPAEGMRALEVLLRAPVPQLGFVKARAGASGDSVRQYPDTIPAVAARVVLDTPPPVLRREDLLFADQRLESLVRGLLARQLAALGERPVLPLYQRWLAESRRVLAETPVPSAPAEALWREWVDHAQTRRRLDGSTPELDLLQTCLQALPAILLGQRPATEVLFPQSSLSLVEAIYRGNPVADLFNGRLQQWVLAYLRERLACDPQARLRILEIGAGTGGTSAGLLAALQPLRKHIAEYSFTDVSRAFLIQAQDRFAAGFPGLVTRLFDVEQPLAAQGLPADHFDLVVAANVLHATSEIRTALRNAKAALRKGGVLLLNEIAGQSLFTHLSFGLLEGWWRYRDPAVRLPASPALSPENWARVLREEGFGEIGFLLKDRLDLGQQLVVAQSDGLVRQAGANVEAEVGRHTHTLSVAPIITATAPPASRAAPAVTIESIALATISEPVAIDAGVHRVLLEQLARTLKLDVAEIDTQMPFSDYGVDSILGVGFVKQINDRLGLDLNATVLFEHSSFERLVAHILQRHRQEAAAVLAADAAASANTTAPAPSPAAAAASFEPARASVYVAEPIPAAAAEFCQAGAGRVEIAVIGMSAQVPGATDVEAFWHNLMHGVDGVTQLPTAYLDRTRQGDDDQAYYPWGGTLAERACFDPQFFSISPREAKSMNPHQRLVLQESWKALEDAGYDPRSLADRRVGSFVGAEPAGYFHETFTGSSDAIIASRLAYFLNLKGPALVINTGCSSSATAIHLACESLRHGESEMALAGGVYAVLNETGLVSLAQLDMLSNSGRCQSFDAAADGTVFSEAVGMVVLKRMDAALRDGDPIYASIVASGINQDGASNGITAPSGEAQEQLLLETYRKFGVDPRRIGYVEAHGTGTRLGDPVEANALLRAFRAHTADRDYCAVGSAKAHIGHTAAASGVIGLVKLLLILKHGRTPGLLHFCKLNPLIEWQDSPFFIPTVNRDWPAEPGQPRMAALNSFGHSGTNVHLVLKEHVEPVVVAAAVDARQQPGWHLLPLSATNETRLRAYAGKLARYLREAGEGVNLGDVAHTLQHGRIELKRRWCLLVEDAPSALAQLQAYAADADAAGVHGLADGSLAADRIDASAPEHLALLARRWAGGAKVDWPLAGHAARRIRLPSYPFSRDQYWMDGALAAPAPAPMHPLLHARADTAAGSRFSVRLSGEEAFFRDHRILGRPTFPGAAYLEMAGAATARVLGTEALRLSVVVWSRPLQPSAAGVELGIELQAQGDGRLRFEIAAAGQVHCQGLAAAVDARDNEFERQDLGALLARMDGQSVGHDACYAAFDAVGIHYGPSHRAIEHLHLGRGEALARLVLNPVAARDADAYRLHPGLLDAALQATLGLSAGSARGAYVPFALERLVLRTSTGRQLWAWVRYTSGSSPDEAVRKYDIDLLDDQGGVIARLSGFAFRPAEATTSSVDPVLLWRRDWQPDSAPLAGDAAPTRRSVLISDRAAAWRFDEPADGSLLAHLQIDSAQEAPDLWYRRVLGELFDLVKAQAQAVQACLLQVLVPASGQATLLSGLSGLLRTATLEFPRLSTQLLAFDTAPVKLAALLEANARQPWRAQLRYQSGTRLVPAWTELAGSAGILALPWREHGVYLLTGGLGGLGRLLAEEILSQAPAATVVLCGRAAPDAQATQWLQATGANGRLLYRQADVADAAQVRALVAKTVERFGALHGVIHSAGVLRDSYLPGKTVAQIDAVLAPKVAGTVNLDEATRALDLDLFVLFAAGAGVLGNLGQADYAAANAFLDAYAGWRNQQAAEGRRRGQAVAIDWPLWAEGGMRISDSLREAIEAGNGMRALARGEGMSALYRGVASREAQLLVGVGDHARLRAWMQRLHAEPAAKPVQAGLVPGAGRALRDRTRQFLIDSAASVLELQPQDLDPRDELSDYGFDSITFTELTHRLNRQFDLELVPTVLFEHPTIAKLTAHLLESFPDVLARAFPEDVAAPQPLVVKPEPPAVQSASRSAVEMAAPSPSSAGSEGAVAIIGMSGRFPGAPDLAGFWQVLAEGRDCIGEIPADRWDWRQYYGDASQGGRHTRVKEAGFIEGVAEFDPLFFGITPREAELMDPQQRLLLTHAWAAIEDAGYAPSSLAGGRTAIFVGTASSGYSSLIEQAAMGLDGHSSTGSVASVGPNRLSYLLDLHGPSEPVETACSSALVAIHRAVRAIRHGDCETALAGGINTIVLPEVHISFDKAGMLSPDGRCKTFSRHADGYGRGEGVGILLLKNLAVAERDGDAIHAVIRGTAENHGGRASSLTAPNPKAQAELIKAAVRDAGIDAASIGYIETHGTGTALGDPIEINGLKAAFEEFRSEAGASAPVPDSCALGSVKTNIGHLELAAGVAGVIKVVLQLRHRTLARSLHAEEPNPYIRLEGSPFHLLGDTRPWPAPRDAGGRPLPRRAGVSSFGFGGVNAHVLLEEYVAAPDVSLASEHGPHLFVLSARQPARLMEQAAQLAAFLRDEARPALAELIHTLQIGRDAMEERAAFLVADYAELVKRLDEFVAGRAAGTWLHRGRARHDSEAAALFDNLDEQRETVRDWLAQGRHDKLLRLWTQGLEVDWRVLHAGPPPRRAHLPTYPFARESYWPRPARPAVRPETRLSSPPMQAANEDELNRHSALLDRLIHRQISADEAVRLARRQEHS